MKENYHLIQFKFEAGVYSLEKMCELVDKKIITEQDFHTITTYNYKAIKRSE
jgi:hypothetical protein